MIITKWKPCVTSILIEYFNCDTIKLRNATAWWTATKAFRRIRKTKKPMEESENNHTRSNYKTLPHVGFDWISWNRWKLSWIHCLSNKLLFISLFFFKNLKISSFEIYFTIEWQNKNIWYLKVFHFVIIKTWCGNCFSIPRNAAFITITFKFSNIQRAVFVLVLFAIFYIEDKTKKCLHSRECKYERGIWSFRFYYF